MKNKWEKEKWIQKQQEESNLTRIKQVKIKILRPEYNELLQNIKSKKKITQKHVSLNLWSHHLKELNSFYIINVYIKRSFNQLSEFFGFY